MTLTGRGDLTARIYRQLLDADPRRPAALGRAAAADARAGTAARRLAQHGRRRLRPAHRRRVPRRPGGRRHLRLRRTPATARAPGPRPRAAACAPAPLAVDRRRVRTPLRARTGPAADLRLPRRASPTRGCSRSRRGAGWSPASSARRWFTAAIHDEPPGHAGLREAIARHIGISRSVRAERRRRPRHQRRAAGARPHRPRADRAGRLRGGRGTRLPARAAALPVAGARVVGVPVDAEGLVVDAIPDAAPARLRHAVPPVPAGHADVAGAPDARCSPGPSGADAVIIEDDYDSEFRFGDRPLEPLQSLDRSGPRHLRRLVLQDAAADAAAGLPGRPGLAAARAARRQAAHRLARRARRRRRRWPGSSTRACSPGTSARRPASTRPATSTSSRRCRRDFTDWLEPVPSAAGLHLCARLTPDAPESTGSA